MSTSTPTRSTSDTNGATRVDSAAHRRSTETKASFKTTELFAYLAAVVGVLIAAGVVDETNAGGFGARQAWSTSRSSPSATCSAADSRSPAVATPTRPTSAPSEHASGPRSVPLAIRLEDGSMSQSKQQQKVVQYLNEAHASEQALVRVLQSQIAMTPRGSYRSG